MAIRPKILTFYRTFQTAVVKNYLLPIFLPKKNFLDTSQIGFRARSKNPRIWFHAASVGELESLWPLIEIAGDHGCELIITILSESAQSTLARLQKHLQDRNVEMTYIGFSPFEGDWKTAIQKWQPSVFVTAKYEAWPDLWISLGQEKVPLVIVSARARKSLRVAKWFCENIGVGLPRLILFSCHERDAEELRSLFPTAEVQVGGEPRWDRVYSRFQKGNQRAQDLIQTFSLHKKPWGIIGSAWVEDLKFLEPLLRRPRGTLWIVPHRIDEPHLHSIQLYLNSLGLEFIRTSQLGGPITINSVQSQCVLVDELGFLLELYSVADWVFVGGGFGAGIHSTIEPALCGAPIATGPNGTEKFSEVNDLLDAGQLTILRNKSDLNQWTVYLEKNDADHCINQKRMWMATAQTRLGASKKIWTALENLNSSW